MYQLILIIHMFTAASLIALVLVQQGKGATIGATFGSGASQTVFGSRGSGSFLFKLTLGLVLIFFSASIGLNYLASRAFNQEKQIVLPVLPSNKPSHNVPAAPKPAVTPSPSSIPKT